MGTPRVVRTVEELRSVTSEARADGREVGFVPTMGALHEGHLALARVAADKGRFVVVSIFVNPTQFGPNEDFARYPRDLAGDVAKLEGVDVVFAPEPATIYPAGETTRVRVGKLGDHLCGPHRPGHFEGVATVVTKLLAAVGPCVAVFGRKDYQQLAILRRMTTDLLLPVRIASVPTIREADGLAKSSRNAYLSAPERTRALALSRGLRKAQHAFAAGERRAGVLERLAAEEVNAAADAIDYVTVADPDALVPFAAEERVGGRALVAIACRIGKTRLIDNVVLGEDAPLDE